MAAPQLTAQVQGQGSVTADMLNTLEQTCDVLDQLRAFIGLPGIQVYLRGGAAVADGLQGIFYWDASSTATDNGVNIIRPTGGAFAGRWVRLPPPVFSLFAGTKTLSAGVATVTFAGAMLSTNYSITLAGNTTAQTFGWSGKTVNGFQINSSSGSSTATVDWTAVAQWGG